jgi:hypothetical protein
MQAKAENKISIYGPKADGTYARDQRASWRDPRAQVFPGADAAWAVRAGRSVRKS